MRVLFIAALAVVAIFGGWAPPSETKPCKDQNNYLESFRSLPKLEEEHINNAFGNFVTKFKKVYSSSELQYRHKVFGKNLRFIHHHESRRLAGDKTLTYSLGVNQFADMSSEEFVSTMNGYKGAELDARRAAFGGQLNKVADFSSVAADALPETVDWVKKGAVTGVKNQGHCGSCWSFSTTGSVEGQHFLSGQFNGTDNLVSLSEQNLMDCSTKEGDMGCNGGLMDDAFKYIIVNKGIDTEASYPYEGVQGTCHYKAANMGAQINSYQDVKSGDEQALQVASATIGPISVAIDAGEPSFQFYNGGVYYSYLCGNKEKNLDHGVLVVGYGQEANGGDKYWLVKNSWSASWGLNGYIKMIRDWDNNCGIATAASYPIITKA